MQYSVWMDNFRTKIMNNFLTNTWVTFTLYLAFDVYITSCFGNVKFFECKRQKAGLQHVNAEHNAHKLHRTTMMINIVTGTFFKSLGVAKLISGADCNFFYGCYLCSFVVTNSVDNFPQIIEVWGGGKWGNNNNYLINVQWLWTLSPLHAYGELLTKFLNN